VRFFFFFFFQWLVGIDIGVTISGNL